MESKKKLVNPTWNIPLSGQAQEAAWECLQDALDKKKIIKEIFEKEDDSVEKLDLSNKALQNMAKREEFENELYRLNIKDEQMYLFVTSYRTNRIQELVVITKDEYQDFIKNLEEGRLDLKGYFKEDSPEKSTPPTEFQKIEKDRISNLLEEENKNKTKVEITRYFKDGELDYTGKQSLSRFIEDIDKYKQWFKNEEIEISLTKDEEGKVETHTH